MSRAISTSILFAIMAEVKEVAIIFDVSDTNTLFIEKKIQDAMITRIRRHQESAIEAGKEGTDGKCPRKDDEKSSAENK